MAGLQRRFQVRLSLSPLSPLLALIVSGQFFDKALRKMIGAFEERAAELYASPGSSNSSAHSAA